MLRLAILFFVVALIAAFLGFGLVADMSYGAARILFFVFIVLAVLSLLGGVMQTTCVTVNPHPEIGERPA